MVYKPTTPDALYKNNFAPKTPGSPASALPFPFKSATTLPFTEPKHGVASAITVVVSEAETVEVTDAETVVVIVAETVGVVCEMIVPGEIVSVARTVAVGVRVEIANTVAVGNSVENTTGAIVGGMDSTVAVGVAVNSACAAATLILRNGVAVSFTAGRIVVSIGGRCPQATRAMAARQVTKRVIEKRERANDIANKAGTKSRIWNGATANDFFSAQWASIAHSKGASKQARPIR